MGLSPLQWKNRVKVTARLGGRKGFKHTHVTNLWNASRSPHDTARAKSQFSRLLLESLHTVPERRRGGKDKIRKKGHREKQHLPSECQEHILIFAARKEVSRSSRSPAEMRCKEAARHMWLGLGRTVCHFSFVVAHQLYLNHERQLMNATAWGSYSYNVLQYILINSKSLCFKETQKSSITTSVNIRTCHFQSAYH